MQRAGYFTLSIFLLALPLFAQGKRLWVLSEPGEMVEYDPAAFAVKNRVKVPAEAFKSPANLSVNGTGQMLLVPSTAPAITDEDATTPYQIWFWNGQVAATLDQGVEHKTEKRGSNQAVTESAPVAYLSADGTHLYWFNNQARRLERDEISLSTTIMWQAWRTGLNGGGREEVTAVKLPECACHTGVCDETCPVGSFWAPESGVGKFFLMTQYIAGQTGATYQSSAMYKDDGDKWTSSPMPHVLEEVLDASPSGDVIVHAIPDAACCGWSNESNDQTLVLMNGKSLTVFDEFSTYKNADYDVSFSTSNAKLSPDMSRVAMTITSTAQANKPIQLAEQGQANPEELQRIRKSLPDLPAVVVKTVEDSSKQLALVPRATLVGWLSEKELLIVEDHLLVIYNVSTGARKKSSVKVEDAARVYLR